MSPGQVSALDGAKRQDIIDNADWRSRLELGLQTTAAQISYTTRIAKYACCFLITCDENDVMTHVLVERWIHEWMLGDVKEVLNNALGSVRKGKPYFEHKKSTSKRHNPGKSAF